MRLCGSRPAVGSSRNSTEGRCITARATISRCAMPPDSASTGIVARSVSWNRSSMSSASRLRLRAGHAEEPTVEVEVLADGQRTIERVGLRHDADQLLGRGRVRPHVDAADERPAARWGRRVS